MTRWRWVWNPIHWRTGESVGRAPYGAVVYHTRYFGPLRKTWVRQSRIEA